MDVGIWLEAWQQVENKFAQGGEEALKQDEWMWLLLRNFIDAVEADGMLGFYAGAAADYLEQTMAALLKIDATEACRILEQINTLFPELPLNADERTKVIEGWQDDAYFRLIRELEDQFFELQPQLEEKLDDLVARVLLDYAEDQ